MCAADFGHEFGRQHGLPVELGASRGGNSGELGRGQVGVATAWTEVERDDSDSPKSLRPIGDWPSAVLDF